MNRSCVIVFLLLFVVFLSSNATDEFYEFTVTSYAKDGTSIGHNQRYELASRGCLAEGTVIQVRFDENGGLNASQKRVVEYAARLWEEKLPTLYPCLNLKVSLEALPDDVLCRTEVNYYYDKIAYLEGASKYTTGATVKFWTFHDTYFTHNLGENLLPYIEADDIHIRLNSNESLFYWGTDGNTPEDKYDAVTIIMRAIMRGLGMNASFRQVGNSYVFDSFVMPEDSYMNYSLYDHMAVLHKGTINADTVGSVATSAQGYVDFEGFRFYVPSVFEYGYSYSSFEEKWAIAKRLSLFKPSINKGESIHFIGDSISLFFRDVFDWDVPIWTGGGHESSMSFTAPDTVVDYNSGYEFVYEETSSTENRDAISGIQKSGIRRATYSYDGDDRINFFGENGKDEWRLDLLREDGLFITVKQLSGGFYPFLVLPRDIPKDVCWARNADGYLRGRIYHKTMFDKTYSFLYVYLDFVPEVPQVSIVEKESPMRSDIPYLYLAHHATGADRVRIKHESEYGVFYYDYSSDSEYLDFSGVDPWVENKFTIYAVNKNSTVEGNTVVWGGEEYMRLRNKYKLNISRQTDKEVVLALECANPHASVLNSTARIAWYLIAKVDNTAMSYKGRYDENKLIVDTRNMPDGVYVALAFDEKGNTYSAKFIVR